MKALLDTNMLVDELLAHPGYELGVSSLSWAELGRGIHSATTPEERARRESLIDRLRKQLGGGVPFDDAAADAYKTVCGLVIARGRQTRNRAIDLMIAATALSIGAGVITRNVADFAGVEDLVPIIDARTDACPRPGAGAPA